MGKDKLLKMYKDWDWNSATLIQFADKFLKYAKQDYKQDIYNASEQLYTYDYSDSGDIHVLNRDIARFAKELKNKES